MTRLERLRRGCLHCHSAVRSSIAPGIAMVCPAKTKDAGGETGALSPDAVVGFFEFLLRVLPPHYKSKETILETRN